MKDWREFTGREWLLVDIANMFGWDKELYSVRIENAEGIVSLGKDKALAMAEEADEKERYRYIRAVTEYFNLLEQAKQNQIPTTGYRVGQDAGASGLQMFSAITGCASGAALCGLTGKVRANAYKTLYDFMHDDNIKFMDALPSDVKLAIMTHFYGSSQKPAELCHFDNQMLQTFYQVMEDKCEGASLMRNLAISRYAPEASELTGLWTPNDTHIWFMPNGATVHNNVISQDTFQISNVYNDYLYSFNKVEGKAKGVSLAADIAHSIDAYVASEMQVRCAYHRVPNWGRVVTAYNMLWRKGYIPQDRVASPYIIPSLNNYEEIFRQLDLPLRLRDTQYLEAMGYMLDNLFNTPSFDEVSVFDEFTCLPNFVGHMKQHYINIMAEIADGDLASQICTTLVGEQVIIDKITPDLSKEILRGDYAIS